jgi:nucleoside-diphosphate-sugar epimerase
LPVPAPDLTVQFIHEEDVGRALLACIVGAGPPGAYNISGSGVLTGADIARALGLAPVPVPAAPVHAGARLVASLPASSLMPPFVGWAEAFSHPAIMDTSKAERELGWRPRYSGADALRSMIAARD